MVYLLLSFNHASTPTPLHYYFPEDTISTHTARFNERSMTLAAGWAVRIHWTAVRVASASSVPCVVSTEAAGKPYLCVNLSEV